MSDATIKSVHNDNGVFVHMLLNNRRPSAINCVRQANVPLCVQNKNSGPFYPSPLPQQKPGVSGNFDNSSSTVCHGYPILTATQGTNVI